VTIPGSSRTSASSEPRRARLPQRLWLLALCLYALAAAGDVAAHLDADRRAGAAWIAPGHLIVSFSAGLFWPVDLVARVLLGR
jgi:hypothetical protein